MNDGPPHPMQMSYLLRVWRETEDGTWRASVENVTSGERHYFGDLDHLLTFIKNGGSLPPPSEAAPLGEVV